MMNVNEWKTRINTKCAPTSNFTLIIVMIIVQSQIFYIGCDSAGIRISLLSIYTYKYCYVSF